MPYAAFEANRNLYHFRHLPFGVTNGVACFQRSMDNLWQIWRYVNLQDTSAYLDNLLNCSKTKEEHDRNLKNFMKAFQQFNLTFNNDKSKFSKTCINFLEYTIANETLRPDPECLTSSQRTPMIGRHYFSTTLSSSIFVLLSLAFYIFKNALDHWLHLLLFLYLQMLQSSWRFKGGCRAFCSACYCWQSATCGGDRCFQ